MKQQELQIEKKNFVGLHGLYKNMSALEGLIPSYVYMCRPIHSINYFKWMFPWGLFQSE